MSSSISEAKHTTSFFWRGRSKTRPSRSRISRRSHLKLKLYPLAQSVFLSVQSCNEPLFTNVQCELPLSEISVPVLESLISYLVVVCRSIWFRPDGTRPESLVGLSFLGCSRLLRSLRRSPCRLLLAGLSLRLLQRQRTSMECAKVSRSRLAAVDRTPNTFYGN